MDIFFSDQAKKDLSKLERVVQEHVASKMRHITKHGFPSRSIKRLSGRTLYRVRVGNYRVIGTTEIDAFIVLLIRHRKDIYRELD